MNVPGSHTGAGSVCVVGLVAPSGASGVAQPVFLAQPPSPAHPEPQPSIPWGAARGPQETEAPSDGSSLSWCTPSTICFPTWTQQSSPSWLHQARHPHSCSAARHWGGGCAPSVPLPPAAKTSRPLRLRRLPAACKGAGTVRGTRRTGMVEEPGSPHLPAGSRPSQEKPEIPSLSRPRSLFLRHRLATAQPGGPPRPPPSRAEMGPAGLGRLGCGQGGASCRSPHHGTRWPGSPRPPREGKNPAGPRREAPGAGAGVRRGGSALARGRGAHPSRSPRMSSWRPAGPSPASPRAPAPSPAAAAFPPLHGPVNPLPTSAAPPCACRRDPRHGAPSPRFPGAPVWGALHSSRGFWGDRRGPSPLQGSAADPYARPSQP